jgi:two-component system sensor histidine kinase UhpB
MAPVAVMLALLGIVLAVECTIMVLLQWLAPAVGRSPLGALLDSLTLAAVLWPAIWLLVVRPLRALHAERGALLARVLDAQEAERARLARDLHDELGQIQTAVLLALRGVTAAGTVEEARERAAVAQQMAAAAVDSTRRIAKGLAPGVLADLGLGAAAERLCEDLESASSLRVERAIAVGAARLPPTVEVAVYRILQEALTNAAKHAGASVVRVELARDGADIRLEVSDDGVGLVAARTRRDGARLEGGGGLGLAGIRERVALLGGRLDLGAGPAGGTTLVARIPCAEATP